MEAIEGLPGPLKLEDGGPCVQGALVGSKVVIADILAMEPPAQRPTAGLPTLWLLPLSESKAPWKVLSGPPLPSGSQATGTASSVI